MPEIVGYFQYLNRNLHTFTFDGNKANETKSFSLYPNDLKSRATGSSSATTRCLIEKRWMIQVWHIPGHLGNVIWKSAE